MLCHRRSLPLGGSIMSNITTLTELQYELIAMDAYGFSDAGKCTSLSKPIELSLQPQFHLILTLSRYTIHKMTSFLKA